MDKFEILLVQFEGKIYFLWTFQFWNFVQGKEPWDIIDGST